MIKVGISGKIAAGKSEVENILLEFNYPVYDLDKISHELYENEKIKNAILKEFNTLDRKEIGNIVFNSIEKKENLEKIIHPQIKNTILSLFEKHKNDKIIFISGALLFKTGFDKLFDKTIFIEANEKIRLERLIKRNNLSKSEAISRLHLQDNSDFADFIIENNSDKNALREKIEKTLKLILTQV